MATFATWVGIGAVVLISNGCVHAYGTKAASNMQARSQIVKGKTTKQEVLRLLGAPTGKTDMGEQGEMWRYTYSRTNVRASTFIPIVGAFAGGVDTHTHDMSIGFDTNGVVKTISEFDSVGGGGGIQDTNR